MKFLRLDDYLNFGEDPIKDINFENKIQEYDNYFSNEIEKKLHEDFLKEYYLCHGFHDWKLISVKMDCFNDDNSLTINLFDSFENIKKSIVYHFVKLFESNFNSEYFESPMNKDFGIDEFGIINDTCLSHEVYFLSGASYIVHFSDIEILSS